MKIVIQRDQIIFIFCCTYRNTRMLPEESMTGESGAMIIVTNRYRATVRQQNRHIKLAPSEPLENNRATAMIKFFIENISKYFP